MIEPQKIDDLAQKLSRLLPADVHTARAELHNNFKSLLASWLDGLDLVTREEFEIQKAVLAKTRAKLEALETQVANLEKEGASD